MIDCLISFFQGKRVLVVGMGREGRSTLEFLQKYCPSNHIGLSDRNKDAFSGQDTRFEIYAGDAYPGPVEKFDMAVVSPGIDPSTVRGLMTTGIMVTTQTDLFMRCYHGLTTGITGTKGKSTTSSLLHHLYGQAGQESFLVGNIGRPALDVAADLGPETKVVYEMSSSQLETISTAPKTAIMLNLFAEHLDRYPTTAEYFQAKSHIINKQQEGSNVVVPAHNDRIDSIVERVSGSRNVYRFSASERVSRGSFIDNHRLIFRWEEGNETVVHPDVRRLLLRGAHNLSNVLAAVTAAVVNGVDPPFLEKPLEEFRGLEHRLEYVGQFGGIIFYNDSISTIPESCIRALESVENVDTLLLGGFDRGLDYHELYRFLKGSGVKNIIFMGPAGERMAKEFGENAGKIRIIVTETLEEAFPYIIRFTHNDRVCLLSPAAASYDRFRNFEERGSVYKKLARSIQTPC